jgi:hypothetical protein
MVGFDQTSHEYKLEPRSNVQVENNHGIEDSSLLKSQKSAKKKMSRRGSSFTKEEDSDLLGILKY